MEYILCSSFFLTCNLTSGARVLSILSIYGTLAIRKEALEEPRQKGGQPVLI